MQEWATDALQKRFSHGRQGAQVGPVCVREILHTHHNIISLSHKSAVEASRPDCTSQLWTKQHTPWLSTKSLHASDLYPGHVRSLRAFVVYLSRSTHLKIEHDHFLPIPFQSGSITDYIDGLCGLVVRVPGYRSRGPGFDSQIFW
jgi:hypothetical protein